MKKKILFSLFLVTCLFAVTRTIQSAEPSKPIQLGAERELFVDYYLIDKLEGTRLILHTPHDEGVVLQFDKPWEGAFCGYATVIKDGDIFRLYYRGLPGAGKDGSNDATTCYAESRDGIHWTKPNLGIFTVNGTKKNNVVMANAAPMTHNFSPFLDTRPDVDPAQRFKALGGSEKSGLIAFVSSDGIHWKKLR
ncbi:MAG: hypothetical protein GWP06_14990, partial [Actinobacteria bacterium]|nr:hypothetical protein [Actinomycetota bacterium]